jgi:aminoglycoside phosphotransferase (APT) family kinase protein
MRRGADWDSLERALVAAGLDQIEIVGRRPCAYRTSFPIEELEVELLGPGRSKLVCKRLDWDGLDPAARLAKPRFLHDPEREACVYERLLPRGPEGPPRFLGAATEAGRSWLFLEWVEGRNLFQVGERDVWEGAATWLGRFHAAFDGSPSDLAARCPVVRRDADFYRRWATRARELGALSGSAARPLLDWLAAKHERLVEALAAMPQTLLHGEFYAANVLVAGDRAATRVAPVDWELAGSGPGALDLAALACGWPAADREAMRLAYCHGRGAELSAFELDLARLQTAIQWLGWAPPEWEPPPGQGRDWVAEATEIAAGLEL